MKLDIYQVDAFAEGVFSGNPASVIPLYEWPSDELMQNIARENNQSETAFYVPKGEYFELRWFTPEFEIDLCGHATMAAAHVIYEHSGYSDPAVVFVTKSGRLFVDREESGTYTMDFPAWDYKELQVTERVAKSIGVRPRELYANDRDMLAVLDAESEVRNITPDFRKINELDCVCLIVTAPGEDHDFVSRVFCPGAGIPEDPVTGSAHCSLVPYWAKRLGRESLQAFQASERGGVLGCELAGDRVRISGMAVTYMQGTVFL
ncbi:PhzF family phenazine biosynthesis protein [Salidesulfovibrio onnuriiensis]|uniref:PhzF family phenazine biosynthesis protein n=1 Tax=Salidesulfovibrio onnuriiensis TaxID=2583823 RepID=UPI0011CB5BDB|nr:PhzF family phenazine biosynthesis protein [Salidesulfovibrio onnuriiensis]